MSKLLEGEMGLVGVFAAALAISFALGYGAGNAHRPTQVVTIRGFLPSAPSDHDLSEGCRLGDKTWPAEAEGYGYSGWWVDCDLEKMP
jgi:hypothetical protein